jgi:hypothetical protein
MARLATRMTAVLGASPRGTLGTVADSLAVITAITAAYALIAGKPVPQALLALVVSALALIFLYTSFRLQRLLVASEQKYARHVSDVSAMPLLADAAAHLAQAVVAVEANRRVFVLNLDNACRSLAELYGIATGTPCRVTVLEVYAPHSERRPGDRAGNPDATGVAARTLAASYPDRPPRDKPDWLEDNTDFDTLLRTSASYFLCNDLPREVGDGYENSHWDRAKIAEFRKNDSWPYRSAIVWKIVGSPYSSSGDTERDLAGFLCVDSQHLGTFSKDFDVPTGQTFAHALYSGLATYRAAQQPDTEAVDPVTTSEA